MGQFYFMYLLRQVLNKIVVKLKLKNLLLFAISALGASIPVTLSSLTDGATRRLIFPNNVIEIPPTSLAYNSVFIDPNNFKFGPYENVGQIYYDLYDHVFDDVICKPPIYKTGCIRVCTSKCFVMSIEYSGNVIIAYFENAVRTRVLQSSVQQARSLRELMIPLKEEASLLRNFLPRSFAALTLLF